jgi:hypothetical protein
MKHEMTKAKMFNPMEYHKNPYNVQNMLVNQVNFPQYFYDNDAVPCVYQDRDYDGWDKAWKYMDSIESGPTQYGGHETALRLMDDDSLMVFARMFLGRPDLVGVRVVRYTNVANGCPCICIQGFEPHEDNVGVETLYTGQGAPNVEPLQYELDSSGDAGTWY